MACACCLQAAIQNLEEKPALWRIQSSTVMASARAEVDTARPFRSVKEAVAVFGERILVGDGHSKNNGNVATCNASVITVGAIHEDGSRRSVAMPEQEIIEPEGEATPAVVQMYSAPSSPPSFASSRSPEEEEGDGEEGVHGGDVIVRGIKKLEAEVAETRQEVARLRKRGAEMEMAVASLHAQLHRGLSKLAEMEADRAAAAARRSIGGDTDVTAAAARRERWSERSSSYGGEYLPSFSHALSLGELDDKLLGGRRRKAQKVKPIVPLIGDIIFSKRKSTKDKGGDGFFSGDLYSVIG